jgi:hypothetical protein
MTIRDALAELQRAQERLGPDAEIDPPPREGTDERT